MAYIGRTLSDFRYPTHMSYTDDTQPLLLKIWDWTVASHFGYGESLAFADIAPRDAITYLLYINSFTKTIIDYTDKQHL